MGSKVEADAEREAQASSEKALALYGYPQCPYCQRVLRATERLGLTIELRNTMLEPRYQQELYEVRGRATVPVLRIEEPDGDVRWLPESADIIRFLEERFGADG
jgi:glutathione S-transferase